MNDLELIRKYQETGCIRSRNRFIENNIGLIKQYLNKYHYQPGLDEDLKQEGVLGMIYALDHYDVSLGIKFSTFVFNYFRWFITDYIRKNVATIDIGRNRKASIFSKLCNTNVSISDMSYRDIKEFSEQYMFSIKEVLLVVGVLSTNRTLDLESITVTGSPAQEVEAGQQANRLITALNTLSIKQAKAIQNVYYNEYSRKETAKIMGCDYRTVDYHLKTAYKQLKEVLS